MSSHIRIFWKRPNSHRLVSEARTFATTVSSTSVSVLSQYDSFHVRRSDQMRTRESLYHQGQDVFFKTASSRTRCDVNNAVEERISKKPITIIQVCNHVAE